MLKDSTVELTGNDRYEGFAVDLIEALAPLLGIKYEIIIQEDENFGEYNNETQKWDGMIGKIISGVSWMHEQAISANPNHDLSIGNPLCPQVSSRICYRLIYLLYFSQIQVADLGIITHKCIKTVNIV